MKKINGKFGFSAIAVGAFALALGLVACGDGGSTNGASNDDDSSSSSDVIPEDVSSSSVILSGGNAGVEGSSSSKANWAYLNPDIDYGEFTDERDGQVYKTVVICDKDNKNCQTWMAENLNYESGDVSSMGSNEWSALYTKEGGSSYAGQKLKANTSLWSSNTGTDEYGFSVLPAGYRYNGGYFRYSGDEAYFWSSSEIDDYYAWG